MTKRIYVNLPVKDLEKTKAFFTKLGFDFDPKFTDDKAACLILGDNIYSMLITESFFKTFTQKEISNARQTTEVLLALEVESRGKVDELVEKAVAAGGSTYRDPDDHAWMYAYCFADLDGHQWEVMYTDESKMPQS